MQSPDSLNQRVVDLEMLVTHLQRDLEHMGDVVLKQQGEIDDLRKTIRRLESELAGLAENNDNSPHTERPPHY